MRSDWRHYNRALPIEGMDKGKNITIMVPDLYYLF